MKTRPYIFCSVCWEQCCPIGNSYRGSDPTGWISLLVRRLFANRISGFFGLDVLVSSVVLWVFVFAERWHMSLRRLWAPIAANLLVGVSLSLPLVLFMLEARLEQESVSGRASRVR